jgi:hypothetical protein
MANSFDRIVATGTSAGSTIATVPDGVQWVIIGFTVANVAGYQVNIDVQLTPSDTYLVKNVPLPEGSTLPLLSGKQVLNAGDTIKELCSVDAGVEYLISYMEMS